MQSSFRACGCASARITVFADNTSVSQNDRLFVRHWDTWRDGRRNHVFKVPLDADGLTAGEPVDLMAGVDGDCPILPFGGADDYVISPDGEWLVYTAKVVEGSEEAWSTDFDLYLASLGGRSAPSCLTEENEAWDTHPVFSPDGTTLAYLAMARWMRVER